MATYYDEVAIEDMEFDEDEQTYYYPCPCGDRFFITVEELQDGEDIAPCPSCSLELKVLYDPDDFEYDSDEEDEAAGEAGIEAEAGAAVSAVAAAVESLEVAPKTDADETADAIPNQQAGAVVDAAAAAVEKADGNGLQTENTILAAAATSSSSAAAVAATAVVEADSVTGGAGAATPSSLSSSSTPLPVIAIDIDEVIGAFLPAIIRWHNATFATPALTLASFHSYRFCEVWGGTNEEATEKVHDFFETPYFLEQLEPIEGAADVLRSFAGKRCIFKVVTSRQHAIRDATLGWLEQHFPGIFADVFFGNHWTRESPDPDAVAKGKMTKKDMCARAGAIALVDDNASYAQQCSGALERVVLFGDYGWNGEAALVAAGGEGEAAVGAGSGGGSGGGGGSGSSESGGGGGSIVRAKDWGEVQVLLDALLTEHEAKQKQEGAAGGGDGGGGESKE